MLLSLPGVEGEAGQASVRASISSLFSWGQASDRAPGEGGQDEGYDGEGGEREGALVRLGCSLKWVAWGVQCLMGMRDRQTCVLSRV